ncbi:MAG: TonB-dependent receptor [bacterium]
MFNKKYTVSIFLLSLFLTGVVAQSAVQGETYSVQGTITDENGDPLPGANVIIQGTTKGASTNLDGDYSIMGLSPGTYEFKVSMMGYESTAQDVTLVDNQKVSFRLLPKAFVSQPVIVTASRTEQRLQDSPVSTTVIESEQITNRNYMTVDEAMRFVGGVTMSDDQVSIRNSTGYAKGTGSRVLLMVDGIPLLSGDTGEIKWDAIPIGQIEQMEVVKSSGGALYGSNAMGGMINIITKKPDKASGYKISTEFGVWDKPAYEAWEWSDKTRIYQRLAVEHSRKMGDVGLILSLEEKTDDSYRQADDFERGQFFSKVNWDVKEAQRLNFMLNVAYEDRGTGLVWRGQSSALEVDSSALGDRVYSSKIQFNAIYDGSSQGGKRYWNVKAYSNYNFYDSFISDNSGDAETFFSKSLRSGVDGQYTIVPFDGHRITSGVEMNSSVIDANLFGQHSGIGGALYTQDEITAFQPLVATLGLRGDIFHVNPDERFDGTTYGQINPKLGLVYHLSENVAVRSNVGTGFRMPSMAELFSELRAAGLVSVQPNPYLKAEQAYSAEAGINWFNDRQSMDFAIFNNWYTNMIEPTPTGVGNQVQFQNIADARIFGLEAGVTWNVGNATKWLFNDRMVDLLNKANVNFNYMFTNAVNITESDSVGETVKLPYRPEHTFMMTANIDYWKHASLIFEGRYASETQFALYPSDESVDQRVINLTNKFYYNSFTFQIKASNLLNWNYLEIDRNIAPIRHYSIAMSYDF